MQIIECVPNVSEGRRPDVIDRLAASVRVPGIRFLDVSSDASHNRSVLTVAGEAPALLDAIVALVASAIVAIDLRTHTGAHPRLGAVDVVPFVPLGGAAMADCVDLARQVGATLASLFDLPVYLYEEAATRPERRRLEQIRRGGFEGLAARMSDPAWRPDFGPARPHPSAGATVVGARKPLIAFNVNLATDRLDVARAVAAAVRASSGGLPSVKAMGVALADRGVVQVSMNLTDYEETSMSRAFETVAREAAARGISVLESEIVGLVPSAALDEAIRHDLKVVGDVRAHDLEDRLRRITPMST